MTILPDLALQPGLKEALPSVKVGVNQDFAANP